MMLTSRAVAPPFVNEKVLKAFNETFVYAEDVVWQETGHIYKAYFWQGPVVINAFYDESGKLVGTIRYYTEKQLPPLVVSKIKRKYPGKTILYITEVSNEEEITYYIPLQDENNLYNIQSDSYGNISLVYRYSRADK
jgi:hypothetical protein